MNHHMAGLGTAMNSQEEEFSQYCLHWKRHHRGGREWEESDRWRGGTWGRVARMVQKWPGARSGCHMKNSAQAGSRETGVALTSAAHSGLTQSGAPGPAALHRLRACWGEARFSLWEMRTLTSQPRPLQPQYFGAQESAFFKKCPVDSYAC